MKVGDIVNLIGNKLHSKWRGLDAKITEIEGRMLTVEVIRCGTVLLVFENEVRRV